MKDGIKRYMIKWYNEKQQRDIIQIIFDKIILNKFEKEYNQLITYTCNCDDITSNTKKYQNTVLNSSDLMCCIFQYLDYGYKFDGDLISCSLVDSFWLYHSWNVNALYYVNLSRIARMTQKCNKNKNDNIDHDHDILRMWQRLIHAKSIEILQPPLDSDVLYNKMLLLRNIEVLTARFRLKNDTQIARFKLLMKRYAPRLTS